MIVFWEISSLPPLRLSLLVCYGKHYGMLKVPGKVTICAWRACNDLLPTIAKLSMKGYEGDMRCLLCSHPFETIGHIHVGCPMAQTIVVEPPFSFQVQVFHSFNFKECMLEQEISLSSLAFARQLMLLWSL